MPLFKRQNLYILFIHIPKTGGKYIYKNLEARGFTIYEPLGIKANGSTIQHNTYHEIISRYNNKDIKKIFSIVRHPVDRIISEYNYYNKYSKQINIEICNLLECCKVKKNLRDNHIRPQCDFIGEKTEWYKYEDGLEECMNELFTTIDNSKIYFTNKINESQKKYFISDLDHKTINQIKSFYYKDFAMFGYTI